MNEIILCKLGEVVLKGLNRRSFEMKLMSNIRRRTARFGKFRIYSKQSTIYVEPAEETCDLSGAYAACKQVFGIIAIARAVPCPKEKEAILATAKTYLGEALTAARSFKVESKRADKSFPMSSIQLSQWVGGELHEAYPHLKVDVHHPELTVYVEVREDAAYVHAPAEPAAGGLPIGMGGRAVSLLSGGLDSPVSSYMIARRGVELEMVHFVSPPYTSQQALDKVLELARLLTVYCGRMIVHIIPFTEIQEELRRSCRQLTRIPAEEYMAYSELTNRASDVWHKAKEENDFASFCPILQELVEYNRKFAGYYDAEKAPYDALLNEYERGVDTQQLDVFFDTLRKGLVPLIRAIGEKPQIDDSFLHLEYPVEQQKAFADYLMEVMGLDRGHCGLGETEHPFTLEFNNKDVRITTNYDLHNVASSMYSVLHEGGHALYELGIRDDLQYTCLTGGVSMGVHESQSRFYENLIGRSRAFIGAIYPKVQEFFPAQLGNVTAEQFYRAVNKVEPSLIRTESDELTYCLHVMVRYEIEKQLIAGTLTAKEVPAAWAELYKEYLGVEVPNDREGCLQDSHWSGGSFGYFPSYALGNAYGAQMLHNMEQEFDVYGGVAHGDLSAVTGWLREKGHQYGHLLEPAEVVRNACGTFDAHYYLDYLTKKYTELYNL